MPAKPPKKPKDASQEQLEEYHQKLELYYKEKEHELAEQQLAADKATAELQKAKANVELRERESEELQERNKALKADLEKGLANLNLQKQSQEDVWKEESTRLDQKRVELVAERKRLEKLAIELENSMPEGCGGGDNEM